MESACLSIIPAIQDFKANHKKRELEVSVGRFVSGSFDGDCTYPFFLDLQKQLQKAADLRPGEWTSSEHRYFTAYFEGGVRGRFKGSGSPFFEKKQKKEVIDIQVTNRPFNLRVSLRSEERCEAPTNRVPTHVRLIQRWSYERTGKSGIAVRYDLSKVQSGKTKQDACDKDPRFEIELEVLNATKGEPRFVSESILQKSLDLLGRYVQKDSEWREDEIHIGKVNIKK